MVKKKANKTFTETVSELPGKAGFHALFERKVTAGRLRNVSYREVV